jgi:hypothetical protein
MRFLAITAAVLLLSGCSVGKAVPVAEEASNRFHAQLDAGKFAEAWQQAAPRLRAAMPQDKWRGMLGMIHARLGKHHWVKTVGWEDNFLNGSHLVSLSQDTQYDNGLAKEQLVFQVTNGVSALLVYHARVDGQTLN